MRTIGYDQVANAAAVDRPTLVLQGGRDHQVTVADDLARWQAGLADRPHCDSRGLMWKGSPGSESADRGWGGPRSAVRIAWTPTSPNGTRKLPLTLAATMDHLLPKMSGRSAPCQVESGDHDAARRPSRPGPLAQPVMLAAGLQARVPTLHLRAVGVPQT